MKMYRKNILIIIVGLIFLSILSPWTKAYAEAPYFTYTGDNKGQIIKTQMAYQPAKQIGVINGERLSTPEHVFVDEQDYIYIADSTYNKVFILDENYQYVDELFSDKFFSIKSVFVTTDSIYVVDSMDAKIYIFDKNTHEFIREIGEPDSPVFQEGYNFSPTHIAVDIRGNIYVRSNGSTNGLIMLNREGEFVTFFGANPLEVPFVDKIRSIFLTKKQEKKMEKVFADVPSNIAIDKKGFIYTVTSSIESNPVKKFNVSGTNYFPDNIIATLGTESIWIGKYNNVYTVTSDGWIFEYNSEGDLLFLFGGKDFNSSRFGLLNRPVSIASNSKDELVVVDQGTKMIQTYQPTQFVNSVHQAMDEYQIGNYNESKDLWQYTLQYNSIFDNARIGLGDAFLREGQPEKAILEYTEAEYNMGISESFWELRQQWLSENLNIVFMIIVVLAALWYTHKLLNKKFQYGSSIVKKLSSVRKIKVIDNLLFIFTFLRHPLDSLYEIKVKNRVSMVSSSIIYGLVIVILIAHHQFTNVLFVAKGQYIIYELSIVIFLFILWVIANYLVCTISDGEGGMAQVYNGTAYALSPIIIIMPIVILLSNTLTLEQAVFYNLPIQAMYLWVGFLMFFMIKDIHNYEVGETFSVILKSLFTMLIIGLFLFVIYSLGNQLIDLITDLSTEVSRRW